MSDNNAPITSPTASVSDQNGSFNHAGDTSFVVTEGNYDIQKMMDISAEETAEHDAAPKNKTTTQVPEQKASDTETDPDNQEVEVKEDDVEVTTETEESKDQVAFKAGDKEYKLPKDAQVSVKVNGKMETISLQEALNRASGGINIDKANREIAKSKKEFETQLGKFKEESRLVNTHAQALLDIEDPMEFAEYYANLKGLNADEVFEGMIKKTVDFIESWSQMTPNEQKLQRENRKLRRVEKYRTAQERLHSSEVESNKGRERLLKTITTNGLTEEDFVESANELKAKLDAGEDLGDGLDEVEEFTEKEIVKYALNKKAADRINNVLGSISKDLASDSTLVSKLRQALVKAEALHGKFSESDVKVFVKQAIDFDNKKLSESLSKTASRVKSEQVSSRKRVDDEGDDITLDEFQERMRYRSF